MDSFRTVTHQGWFGRLGGALKGLLGGVVLLAVSIGLQFWNEGRTVQRDAALAEARAEVRTAGAAPVAGLEGRLVHVSGDASAATPVSDEAFGVNAPALALRRRVEMFQWREKRDRREEKQVGGGTRTVTEYRYETRWDDELVDSAEFQRSEGHENPATMPYASEVRRADGVRLDGYALDPAIAAQIEGWERMPLASIELPANLAASFRADDEWFTTSANPDDPQVGDLRVRFDLLPAGAVSVIARQQGGALVPHQTSKGETLALVERGRHDAGGMLAAEGARNSRLGWILRGVGFVLAWVGFAVMFRPLVVLADVLPILGRLAGFGTFVLSGLLAMMLSLLGIGGGWLWHRPWLLGLVLLALAAGVVWLLRLRRGTAPPAIAPVASSGPRMPPPPPPA